ncbi:RibD family protein [Microbacterium sp. ASV49]|uniref:Dihydrofolate reductase family protein n=1 Tax=Microbacterium candidum TaxID=3041922 RepID=A0ABT7MVF6_9MICO|nr:dihydrofolate reductase family protein [Microbacterium sp. ASV49]MDL9978405.1 dihydrofolate reductase family protein [Microbacterium sp. ASV49]
MIPETAGAPGVERRPRVDRPYVTVSSAMSIDGYLDSAGPERLTMSNAADFDRVDEVRARSDAILVGATTVRRDDPRLLVRDATRRRDRIAAGLAGSPVKVTVTASGRLSPHAAFFTTGDGPRLVYCPAGVEARLRTALGDRATVVGMGDDCVDMARLVDDLGDRGVRRLMVEGGGHVLTQFLAADLVDELHLVVAPFFVGDADAPRFVRPARFPWTASRRATLASSEQIGDVVLLRYALSDRFDPDVPGSARDVSSRSFLPPSTTDTETPARGSLSERSESKRGETPGSAGDVSSRSFLPRSTAETEIPARGSLSERSESKRGDVPGSARDVSSRSFLPRSTTDMEPASSESKRGEGGA